MATNKPKVQGYVSQEAYNSFLDFQSERGLSQSQALDLLLRDYFEHFTPKPATDSEERLNKLEEALGLLFDTPPSPAEEKLETMNLWMHKLTQQLEALTERVSRLESPGNLPSDSPLAIEVDKQSSTSNLSDTPEHIAQQSSTSNLSDTPEHIAQQTWGLSVGDAVTITNHKKYTGHTGKINSILPGNLYEPKSENPQLWVKVDDDDYEVRLEPTDVSKIAVQEKVEESSTSNLISNPPSAEGVEVEEESVSNLLSDSPSDTRSVSPNRLPKIVIQLTIEELAKRLKTSGRTLYRRSADGTLSTWSQAKDPDHYRWRKSDNGDGIFIGQLDGEGH